MREWNAETYHRVSNPQFEWGVAVLERLPLTGDELVIDVGCGTGRLTAKLLDRLPQGRVVCVDISANMLRVARETLLPQYGGRVEFVLADASALPFERTADAIFSTATFHWLVDHPALFRRLHDALAAGGRLVAQCGGGPNLKRVKTRAAFLMTDPEFARFFVGWRQPWEFADADTTARRLADAGFTDIQTSVEPARAAFPDGVAYAVFLMNVICRPFLPNLPDSATRDRFIARLTELAARDQPPYELDYWRLNISARRAGSS